MARAIDATELQRKMCALCNQDYYDEPCDPRDCVFSRAINDAPTLTPPWISVEERRPEKHTCVLTYCDDGHIEIDAILSNGEWARTPFDPGEVTHWMPLPEPPEAPHE